MSVTLTQQQIIDQAVTTLGVYQPGETVDPSIVAYAQTMLTELIDSWATQALTVLTVDRAVWDITAGKGGPDDPYTLGPGGDWDTGTAARPEEICNANLLLNGQSGVPIEIPLAIITDDMYAQQAIKTQTNPLPQWLYYNPTIPLGRVYLWNVPTNATNQIVLYTPTLTPQFADLDTTAYVCPPGYAKAFRLCLASALITALSVSGEVAARVTRDAEQALIDLKLNNAKMADLELDMGYTPNPRGTYVIQTDQGA